MPLSLSHQEMMKIIVQLITVGTGGLGFAMMFKMSPRKLPVAMLGGMVTYTMYQFVYLLGGGIMAATFCAALVMAIFSEVFARIMKAPSILFLYACLIPIVPGNALYNAMYNLLFYNEEKLLESAKFTMETVLGVAVGLGVGTIIIGIILQIAKVMRTKNSKE